jgi:hypothetical protein
MARAFLLFMLLFTFTGCSIWRSGSTMELVPSDDSRLLITHDRAYELEIRSVEQGHVYGVAERVWQVPPVEIRDLEKVDLSGKGLAAQLGWTPLPWKPGTVVDIDTKQIRYIRVYEPRTGRTLLLVVALGIPLAAIVGFAILAASVAPCGRPLRVRGKRCVTPIANLRTHEETPWFEPVELQPVPADARATLIEVWTQEAQAEHAAIAAFSKLALELIAHGAPPALIAGANKAAIQEVQHAKLCFALASAYSGEVLAPAPFPAALAHDTTSLERLARESLLDGCMREGLASIIARLGAETARDPVVARVLRIQAREEAQHAALAWDILDWCLERGGTELRRTLLAALREADMPRCDDLPEHGRASRAVVEPYFVDLREQAQFRLLHPTIEVSDTGRFWSAQRGETSTSGEHRVIVTGGRKPPSTVDA